MSLVDPVLGCTLSHHYQTRSLPVVKLGIVTSQNHAAAFWRRPPVQRRMADAEAAFQRGDSLPTELLAALNERVEQIPDIVSSTYVCVGNPAVSSTPPEQQGALAGIPLSIKDLFDSWSSRPSCTIPLYANA